MLLAEIDHFIEQRLVSPVILWYSEKTGHTRFRFAKELFHTSLISNTTGFLIMVFAGFLPWFWTIPIGLCLGLLMSQFFGVLYPVLDVLDKREHRGQSHAPNLSLSGTLLRLFVVGGSLILTNFALLLTGVSTAQAVSLLPNVAGVWMFTLAFYVFTTPAPPPRKEVELKRAFASQPV